MLHIVQQENVRLSHTTLAQWEGYSPPDPPCYAVIGFSYRGGKVGFPSLSKVPPPPPPHPMITSCYHHLNQILSFNPPTATLIM